MERKPIHVSLVVFRECDPSILYGVFDTLWAVGRDFSDLTRDTSLFTPRIVGVTRDPIELITGVSIIPQLGIDEVPNTDVVFVPNVIVATAADLRALDRRLLQWIAQMHGQGSQVYASCGGSLALAEAGLLKGLEATTHWNYAPLFQQEFPDVTLHVERLLVQTGQGHSVACSGGASSWQDLALLLIARHWGTEEAIRISKLFLYQWHRDGQLPYASMIQNVKHGDETIARCQQWIARNYGKRDLVAEVVQMSGLPKRTFDRRFKAATGYSPLAYIQTLRVEEAKHVLETTDVVIERVGQLVGYEDGASFRKLFRKLCGLSPADYRRKLQPPTVVRQLGRPLPARYARNVSDTRSRKP
jgi:transcriptional regulator GlxA family with amidase domain